jgi:translation initiation factor 4G
VLNKALDQNESERELIYFLMMHVVKDELATRAQFLEAFKNMLDLMGDLEADIPRIKSYVAAFAALAISEDVFTLAEVAESVENGNHYPFLLLVLQQLGKTMEKLKLCKLFDESKINLLNTLPKIDRTKDRMAEILEERELHFLFPLLKIQAEMAKQLQNNSDTMDFLTWIKDGVDPAYYTAQGFISALITVIFKYVTADASQAIGTELGSVNEKAIKEKEKELLLKFKPVIGSFLRDQGDLQIIAVYALQAAWFAVDSPKVMLLRWFMNMYELEIIEEEAFLKWKEDIRDDYPGKGNALFQVNQWLLWLEQADEEDEEGDGDQDN